MRFEQLDVWKRASRLSCQIYQVTESVSNWGFKEQITRSGLSVPSNIADKSAGATFERCDLFHRPRRGEVHGCTK